MKESIEDRIIAYFDGRLTDDESADLLHRVSVSPEIRRLFREHEMLREVARTAQATAVVRPEVESSLFARIETIAASEATHIASSDASEAERKRRIIAPLFWTRWRLGLAAATGAFLIGAAITLGPELIGNDDQANDNQAVIEREQSTAPRMQDQKNGTASEQAPLTSPDKFESPQEFAQESVTLTSKPNFTKQTGGDRKYQERMLTSERPQFVGEKVDTDNNKIAAEITFAVSSKHNNLVATSGIESFVMSERTINTVAIQTGEPLKLGGERGIAPVFHASAMQHDQGDRFELTIESSTGFAYPASDPTIEPFADTRLSFGYFFDSHNIVGIRATYGLFEVLPQPKEVITDAYTSISRNLETARLFNPGLYYTHREYGVLSDYINVDATVGAGYILDGYTVSGELGLRFPISSHFTSSVTFSLTRVHLDAGSMEEVMQSMDMINGPVIFEGSDVRNSLNGRIQYGFGYQF